MTPWDHFGKSLPLPLKIFLAVVTLANQSYRPAGATSQCSNSFRFDQLCPDPRFGIPKFVAATFIQLERNQGMSGGSSTFQSQSGVNSMSIKDPSTTSCDFHRNGMETAVLTGVHITENPWNFRHANTCTNIVKLSYNWFSSVGSPVQAGRISVSNSPSNKKEKICNNEIGVRRHGSSEDIVAANDELADELARKTNVYFWHNFTVFPHSVQFVDKITNHHLSKEEVSCVNAKTGKYAQIATVVHRSGRCEIIVQQYLINETRSRWGCSDSIPIPYPIQFCGKYECSQINNILTGLKLLSRRDANVDDSESSSKRSRHGQSNHPSSQYGTNTAGENDGATESYSDYDEYGPDNQQPPCVTEITTAASADDEPVNGGISRPMDWRELAFLSAFPMCGVFFILIVLNILRSRSAREICRGYSYPRPVDGLGFHPPSCAPIDKSLPM